MNPLRPSEVKRIKRIPAREELLGLWRGDEDSTGYAHEGLARQICRALKPATESDLYRQLYPGIEDIGEVELPIRKLIHQAFKKWSEEKEHSTS